MPRPSNREVAQGQGGGAYMRNIYVAGLPPNFTDALLLNLITANCCDAGMVESLKCVMDPRSHQCRGFGFVLFRDAAQATNAVQTLDGSSIPDHLGRLHSLQVRPAHPSAQPTKHDITTRSAAQVSTKAPPPYNSVYPGPTPASPQFADPAPRDNSVHAHAYVPRTSSASVSYSSDPAITSEGAPSSLNRKMDELSCGSGDPTADPLLASSPLIAPHVFDASRSVASSSLRVGRESHTSSSLEMSTAGSSSSPHDCQASTASVFHNAAVAPFPHMQVSSFDGSGCTLVASPPAQAIPMPAQVLLLPQAYGMIGAAPMTQHHPSLSGVEGLYGRGPLVLHPASYPPVGHPPQQFMVPSYPNSMFFVAAAPGTPPTAGGPTFSPIRYSFAPDSTLVPVQSHGQPHLIQTPK